MPQCETHKVKFGSPYVDGADVIRKGECINCGQTVSIVYGYAGAFIGDDDSEVAFEEVAE